MLRYTATHSSRTYLLTRTISYVHPNNFVTEEYEVTIPSGNTDTVKLYMGGDTAPGGSDTGNAVMVATPVRTVYSVNPVSEIQVGYGEIPGEMAFDGAQSGSYSAPYATVRSGGDIGFGVNTSNHDAGLMVQWTIGSTPGVHERALRAYIGERGASVSTTLGGTSARTGVEVDLNLQILNTASSTETGLGYTFALPSGLTQGSSSPTNTCGGTLSAPAGGTTVTLSGVSVAASSSCKVTAPVQSDAAGTYQFTSAAATSVTGLINGITTKSLTISESGICPSFDGWTVISDQVQRLYKTLMGRSADAAGQRRWTQARLSGLSALDLVTILLSSSERVGSHGELSDSAFIDQLYADGLGRSADSGGKAYWLALAAGGSSRSTLALGISDSAESVAHTGTMAPMTDGKAQVCRLYRTLLGRTPDAAGLSHWEEVWSAGQRPYDVAAGILEQPEAANLGQLTSTAFVDRLYDNSALNRTADTAGRDYWVGLTATLGRHRVAVWLANSLESIFA